MPKRTPQGHMNLEKSEWSLAAPHSSAGFVHPFSITKSLGGRVPSMVLPHDVCLTICHLGMGERTGVVGVRF